MSKKDRIILENSLFNCSICNQSVKNTDGYYMVWDNDRSVKVCKIHIPDRRANREELKAYKFIEEQR